MMYNSETDWPRGLWPSSESAFQLFRIADCGQSSETGDSGINFHVYCSTVHEDIAIKPFITHSFLALLNS